MITKGLYYKREIYIAHASPSVTDNVIEVKGELDDTINEYEREALIKLLGYHLATLFMETLDKTKPGGLKGNMDVKWDELLNGKIYTSPITEKSVSWKGIRFQNSESQPEPDISLLAYYVYYFYQSNDYITIGGAGAQIENAKNAERVVPTQKVVKAWNKFVAMAQDGFYNQDPIIYNGGLGVDYFGGNNSVEISLYRFISDMNTITEDYYEGFEPSRFDNVNQFGI